MKFQGIETTFMSVVNVYWVLIQLRFWCWWFKEDWNEFFEFFLDHIKYGRKEVM